MPRVVASVKALPPNVISQEEVRELCGRIFEDRKELQRLLPVMDRAGVRRRHFAFPPNYYLAGKSFEERNADFLDAALGLAEEAGRGCLEQAEVRPDQVDHLIVTTTTGLATPSVDARLVRRLGLKADVRRWPLFGLGCAGGAGAVIRAADLLRGMPGGRALVVAVELCGQIFSARALRPVDVIAAGLFGDGAAAALVEGDRCSGRGPAIQAVKTVLFEDTERIMGWSFTGDGMRIMLSPRVTGFVGERLKEAVERFLGDSGLSARMIAAWILHPGGRRIIEAYGKAFGLDERALEWTRTSLANVGNLSSASVLAILSDVMSASGPGAGEKGLMIGLGPGFAAEMVLLSW